MAALPYMQFYVADYLADTMHLSAEEHGAYLLLIFNYWQTGKPIPKTRLQKIARLPSDRWTVVEDSLSEFFNDNGTEWVHPRVEADLAAVEEAQKQRSAAGKASAESRKHSKRESIKRGNKKTINERSTAVGNSLQRNDDENSTNKDKTRQDKTRESTRASGVRKSSSDYLFARWYAVYPNKKAKQDARKAWDTIKPDRAMTARLIRAVRLQVRWRHAVRRNDPDAFIPQWKHPASWIRSGSWEDELEIPKEPTRASEQRRSASDFVMTEFD